MAEGVTCDLWWVCTLLSGGSPHADWSLVIAGLTLVTVGECLRRWGVVMLVCGRWWGSAAPGKVQACTSR